jgi:hypothetical protein
MSFEPLNYGILIQLQAKAKAADRKRKEDELRDDAKVAMI